MSTITIEERMKYALLAADAKKRGEDPTPYMNILKGTKVEIPKAREFSISLINEKIKGYFEQCDAEKKIPTEFKLAKSLGVSVDTLHDWADGVKDVEYQPTIVDAYTELSDRYAQLAATDKRSSIGIFLLKQKRFGGYQDKSDVKQEATIKIIHDSSVEESDFE